MKQKKTAWPTKAAMEQIYDRNLWGSHSSEFYSGDGSHHPEIVEPYLEIVSLFLSSFELPLVVCDLGCGDFNVGKHLVQFTKQYHAIDIVEDLIQYNRTQFKDERLEFHCLDIAEDELPEGDCVLLRQVLQHLSNAEVRQVLSRLNAYNYIIVTEHIPESDFEPNTDIISGRGTRLKYDSGLNLLASPFQFKVKEAKQLLTLKSTDGDGLIVTTLYTMTSVN